MIPTVCAKKDAPTIKVNEFEHYPMNLNYFKDSDVVLFQDEKTRSVYRSTDAGATWSKVDTIGDKKAFALIMHEYDPSRAYVLTQGMTHWRTHDRGKTWETFFTGSELSIFRSDWLVFHAGDPDRIMFNGMDCESIFCDEVVMYTTDGFRSDARFLRGMTSGCWWAKSSDLFTTGQKDLDDSRILCIVRGAFSPFKEDNRLLISDNYFSATSKSDGVIQEYEPNLGGGNQVVQGIVNLAVVKKFMLVATTSKNTDEMALYVSDDTKIWHRAVFPTDHRLNQEAYTVLEGTNYSIQVDVMTTRPSNPIGVLLTSNSNGTYFTRNFEHTNRNLMGHVDFEKISGIQGIFLVNQVANYDEVTNGDTKKKIKTKITFDDGRSFEAVKASGNEIHLHSVTELNNIGRVFSSPAPGLVMGNGNEGDYLRDYADSNLYVSDDAGKTWLKGLEGPHKYEFGDSGSVLLAVHDSGKPTISELKYSLDHGKTWGSISLPNDLKIKPWVLTTTQDSTSLKFILTGESGDPSSPKFHIISIDFEGMHEATCKSSDMEDWFARKDDNGNPTCLMGHTQKYHRRKKDAECFIKQEFKDVFPETTPCECTDADFECDFNFIKQDGKCVKQGPVILSDGACKSGKPDETFKGSNGWRLIPGNDCKRKSGEQKDELKEWKCSDATNAPSGPGASGNITHTQTVIKGDFDQFEKHYLERGESSTLKDETIIMRPVKTIERKGGDIMITQDHGKTWKTPEVFKDQSIWLIATHPHLKDMAFFISKKKVWYTVDRGLHFDSFEPPNPPDLESARMPISFHPDRKDWLIWHGKKCPGASTKDCHLEASVSEDRGDHWRTIVRYVDKCEFVGASAYKQYMRHEKQIICLAKEQENNDEGNPLHLISSDDFFELNKEVGPRGVKDFATMAEFIVVATENQTASTLTALASLNGKEYAPAHFPYNFEVPHQHAYTVLDSSTHAVNLFVVTETVQNRRFGSIIKSNSNGTSYVLSVSGVNCDNSYYVDFEKMLGLQGVVLVNVVANRDSKDSEPKRLQTQISHNDGAEWSFLPPPKEDLDGKKFSCSSAQGDASCALHIHGYTERADHRKTYSSESAVGIMFGWGNVGPALGNVKDADTYMTTDAGISWKMVKKGRWVWTFGDQGSIIVLAQRETQTNTVSYTLDEGKTLQEYQFADSKVVINDVTTVRSGASRNFLIWGHQGDHLFTVNVDFSGLTDRVCNFDKDLSQSDYALWTPMHPKQPNGCLFGHQSQYLRKKTDRQCYNANKLQHLYVFNNCTCTRQDYECDFNFELDNHGSCSLVQGLQPLSFDEYCKQNPDAPEFYPPSGYRRIPLTTCEGGNEFDKTEAPRACPGHEEEFKKAHGASGVAIFFAVVIPIGVAAAVGWWVYTNWNGKFGQIRLGEQSSFDHDSPWVKYPVIVVSAAVAVIGALPLLASSAWRSASSLIDRVRGRSGGRYSWLGGNGQRRFTTRDSFARGRADYAVVDEDEGELLGDDSDEEV